MSPKLEKKYRRVLFVSAMNGWSIFLTGILGLIAAILSTSTSGSLVAAGVSVSGWMEVTGRAKLKLKKSDAGAWLTWSQLVLMTVILTYAGYQLQVFDPANVMSYLSPEMQRLLQDLTGLHSSELQIVVKDAFYALYRGLIIGTIFYQGGMWLYYRMSVNRLSSYLQ